MIRWLLGRDDLGVLETIDGNTLKRALAFTSRENDGGKALRHTKTIRTAAELHAERDQFWQRIEARAKVLPMRRRRG